MAPPRKKTRLSKEQPSEIIFDINARKDYLTGFHKRKVARKEHAQEQAVKRAREEKIVERRQMREQRKADLEKHVHDINVEYKKMNPDLSSEDDNEEDAATEEPIAEAVDPREETEYVDEDKYTTVTVEPMQSESEEETTTKATHPSAENENKRRPSVPKKKKKKFRYETKAERKETRMKQKAKNARQAKARKEGGSHS